MRTSQLPSTASSTADVAAPTTSAERTSAPPPPDAAAPPTEKVSVNETEAFRASLATSVNLAATEREARLSALAQAVRSGAYRPSASRLADQILAEAELDARIAASMS